MDPIYTVRLWADSVKADDMATAREAQANYSQWIRNGGFPAVTSSDGTIRHLNTDKLMAIVEYPSGIIREMGPTGVLLSTGAAE